MRTVLRFTGSALWSLVLALGLILLFTPDHLSAADEFNIRLSTVASGQRFDLLSWIVSAFVAKVDDKTSGIIKSLSNSQRDDVIKKYFQLARDEEDLRNKAVARKAQAADESELENLEAQRSAKRDALDVLQRQVEAIIAERVELAAQAEGLAQDLPLNPQIVLPPVEFRYVVPPLLLVLSPHDHIVQSRTVHLLADMSIQDIEATEAAADKLGYVSLVVPIGGVGTYPTMVLQNSSYDTSLEIVSHEWTHNYLDIRPLGMHYGDNGAMTSINETTANISGHELANLARGLPVPSYEEDPPAPPPGNAPGKAAEFDYNVEMRQTRLAVDDMLKAGDVHAAEAYMEERRQVFVAHGYALRKLNQAYFAFYGSYADGGVGTINPIGGELKRLRKASGSLKAYLETISQISSFDEYRALLKAKGIPEGKR